MENTNLKDLDYVIQALKQIGNEQNLSVNERVLVSIAKTKLKFFGKDNFKKCPCYPPDDNEHGCNSVKCLSEIADNGVCHCNLFSKKRGA